MAKQKNDNKVNGWSFRREVTLGTMLHLAALLIMLAAGWSNLQKDLALIRHELNQLNSSNTRLQKHMEDLNVQCREHEYRLTTLEEEKKS
jgi:cell division protein FtsB